MKHHEGYALISAEELIKALGPRIEARSKQKMLDPRIQKCIIKDAPTANIIQKEKTGKDVEVISHALSKHFIFTNMSIENRVSVIDHMKLYMMGPGEIVFEQNTVGQNFYIVARGKLEVVVNEKRVNVLESGESFGELAIVQDTLRSATVKTMSKVYLWVLDRETFRNAIQKLKLGSCKENKEFIKTVPLFSILNAEQIDCVLQDSSMFSYKKNQKIVNEDDPGHSIFIIKKGKVGIFRKGTRVSELGPGAYFGIRAVLYRTPNRTTKKAETDVTCLVVSRKVINLALGRKIQQVIYEYSIRIAIRKSPILSKFDNAQQGKLAEKIKVTMYNSGDIVIAKGEDKSTKLWIVIQGKLKEKDQIIAETYQCIGDMETSQELSSIIENDIIAEDECHIGVISKNDFEASLGFQIPELLENNQIIKALKNVAIFSTLSTEKIYSIISKIKTQTFNHHDVIVEQNTQGEDFFLIKSGKVSIVQDGILLRVENKTDYFGERGLLFNEVRTASVIAEGQVTCWILKREDFLQILEPGLLKRLIERINLQDSALTLNDLRVIKLLGKGTFGRVFLVIDVLKHRYFALKAVHKAKIEAYKIQEHLLLERRILLSLDHVMALKLVKTFKDADHIYFLTEYVKGLDLFDVIRILNLLTEPSARFYISCILLVLDYLHEREIIFRDLKPENVLVDIEGYPKLIDFGAGKFISGRTYTIIGTPHYMAPEIILGQGYSHSADLWSLGIMLYEFLFGGVPFGNQEDNPSHIYEAILARKLYYPSNIHVSEECKDLIEQLLNRRPLSRKGGSSEGVKSHEWFKRTEWDKLLSKDIPAPYIPRLTELNAEVNLILSQPQNLKEIINRETEWDYSPIEAHENTGINWDDEF